MIPLSEVQRLQLKINTSITSTLIGANNLPIKTMGATHLPIIIKDQQKDILAYISPNPKAPTILGLNFLHEFRLTLAFDGSKSYLTDALANYDFEKECCFAATTRQQAVSSNINYLVTEQISDQNQYQGKPSPIIIPEDEDLRFDPLSLDNERENISPNNGILKQNKNSSSSPDLHASILSTYTCFQKPSSKNNGFTRSAERSTKLPKNLSKIISIVIYSVIRTHLTVHQFSSSPSKEDAGDSSLTFVN